MHKFFETPTPYQFGPFGESPFRDINRLFSGLDYLGVDEGSLRLDGFGTIQTNLVRHEDDSGESYTLQYALPGYDKEDLRVEQQDKVLIVRTSNEFNNTETNVKANGKKGEWVHHGIPHKGFEIRRVLGKGAYVTDTSLKNGILSVSFSFQEEKKSSIGFEIK